MFQIIAIANQKGGVGKTTTCVNLGIGLAQEGKKVLLIDSDPQGSLTISLGYDRPDQLPVTLSDIMEKIMDENTIHPNEGILPHEEGVSFMPANISLSGMEVSLVNAMNREKILKQYLDGVKRQYDYVLIDCMPSLGMLTVNALAAADGILIPVQCEYYALEGLSQLMNSVRRVKRQYNPHLELEGVLLTMYDGRLNLTQQVVEEVKKYFPKKVFAAVIPRSVRLSEAPSFGTPICYFDKGNKGTIAYRQLAEEILAKPV